MKKIWDWLVTSSADPEKTSVTVKGFLTAVGSFVLLLSPVAHLQISNEQVNAVVDLSVQLFLAFSTIISTVMMMLGFARKIYLTVHKVS